jgi:hypothetical protein
MHTTLRWLVAVCGDGTGASEMAVGIGFKSGMRVGRRGRRSVAAFVALAVALVVATAPVLAADDPDSVSIFGQAKYRAGAAEILLTRGGTGNVNWWNVTCATTGPGPCHSKVAAHVSLYSTSTGYGTFLISTGGVMDIMCVTISYRVTSLTPMSLSYGIGTVLTLTWAPDGKTLTMSHRECGRSRTTLNGKALGAYVSGKLTGYTETVTVSGSRASLGFSATASSSASAVPGD